MANTKAIIAAIDNVGIVDVHTTTEQHAGTRINGYFRPTGRNEITTVSAVASGRFGEVEFSVTKTETIKYQHDAEGDITSEVSVGTDYVVKSDEKLGLGQAQALMTQAGFKF